MTSRTYINSTLSKSTNLVYCKLAPTSVTTFPSLKILDSIVQIYTVSYTLPKDFNFPVRIHRSKPFIYE